jgi:hypothetical protein
MIYEEITDPTEAIGRLVKALPSPENEVAVNAPPTFIPPEHVKAYPEDMTPP